MILDWTVWGRWGEAGFRTETAFLIALFSSSTVSPQREQHRCATELRSRPPCGDRAEHALFNGAQPLDSDRENSAGESQRTKV